MTAINNKNSWYDVAVVEVRHDYDVVVVGAGHAGCEAALASARMGMRTIVFCISLDSVGNMPCNPNIGGTSKGCLVREVDALGGEMGKAADATTMQSRMLNRSKGPAVYSLRAQIDRRAYQEYIKRALEDQQNLDLRQAEVVELLVERVGQDGASVGEGPASSAAELADAGMANSGMADAGMAYSGIADAGMAAAVVGVRTHTGALYRARAVVLATGTYLDARIIVGEYSRRSGPDGLFPATELSASLRSLGLRLMRFKTGTPSRVNGRSVNYDAMEVQAGDDPIQPFSYETERVVAPQTPCWITHTNARTHEIIRENLSRSPLYSGAIEGIGARYCPSIEDKVVRFPGRSSHQVFVEPMGRGTREMYLAGMSTSMPEDVQERMVRSVVGLERAMITRNGYAIEYDCLDPTQLKLTLESRRVRGLFAAGQVNGTSGYEEAAAQGVLAGVNAALMLRGEPGLVIRRSEGYVGVLVDDLVTKGVSEPYRMMTSRAEYRLLLRQDNADARLTPYGRRAGLIGDARYARFLEKRESVEWEVRRLEQTFVPPTDAAQAFLASRGSSPIRTGASLAELLRRPEISYADLAEVDPWRSGYSPSQAAPSPAKAQEAAPSKVPLAAPATAQEAVPARRLRADEAEQVEVSIKYAGYIARQQRQVEQFKKLESKRLPQGTDYTAVRGLSVEAAQKLCAADPDSVGQASRITGVSPADISVLLVWLAREEIKRGSRASSNQRHQMEGGAATEQGGANAATERGGASAATEQGGAATERGGASAATERGGVATERDGASAATERGGVATERGRVDGEQGDVATEQGGADGEGE